MRACACASVRVCVKSLSRGFSKAGRDVGSGIPPAAFGVASRMVTFRRRSGRISPCVSCLENIDPLIMQDVYILTHFMTKYQNFHVLWNISAGPDGARARGAALPPTAAVPTFQIPVSAWGLQFGPR